MDLRGCRPIRVAEGRTSSVSPFPTGTPYLSRIAQSELWRRELMAKKAETEPQEIPSDSSFKPMTAPLLPSMIYAAASAAAFVPRAPNMQ